MQLSKNFTLDELTVTSHREIDNAPPAIIMPKLTVLAAGLERVRTVLGKPWQSLSGYRCPALNCIVGGAMTGDSLAWLVANTTYEFVRKAARARLMEHNVQKRDSQHMDGEADDGISPSFGTPFDVCRAIEAYKNTIQFDQLIYEGTWCHVSFVQAKPRLQVLTLKNGGYVEGLIA